jgi:hypothetical protein
MIDSTPTQLLPKWPWQKVKPKSTLIQLKQEHSTKPWILDAVQAGHWISLALLFMLTWIIFINNERLTEVLGSRWQTFALLLWPILQAQASLAPMLMHARESWQLAPAATCASDGNDALLRIHAYRFLFSGLSLSQLTISLAVFGIAPLLICIQAPVAAVVLAGPSRPLLPLKNQDAVLVPIAIPLAVAFTISAIMAGFAMYVLYATVLSANNQWPILAITPLLLGTAGGMLEGGLAETEFNQWWHLLAIATIAAGVISAIGLTNLLVQGGP